MTNNSKGTRPYVRQPVPKVYTEGDLSNDALESGVEGKFEYRNKPLESSEVKKIVVFANPAVNITITYTVGGKETTVLESTPLSSLPLEGAGYIVPLKWGDTDKSLSVGFNESLYVKLSHTLGFNLGCRIVIYKDQLLWIPPQRK